MKEESTVFIVDDDEEVREALQFLLESVGLPSESFPSAQAYLAQFNPKRPGCLVLDVRMRGMSGLALQEQLVKETLSPPIIIITGHGDVPMAVRAVQAGAVDFLEKPFNEQQLLDSIHRALEQDDKQRGQAMKRVEIQNRLERLTKREREVLDLVLKGKRNKVMAAELGISQSTIEVHRARVMEKMEAKSLSSLMRMMLSLELNQGTGSGNSTV